MPLALFPALRRGKLPSEFAQQEMNSAKQALHREDGHAPFGESYLGKRAGCVVDFWLHIAHQAHPQHFQADCHLLTGVEHFPIVLSLVGEPVAWALGDVDAAELELRRHKQDGGGVAVFVVIGEVAQQAERVYIGTVPTVGVGIFRLVWLERFDEPAMLGNKERAGAAGVVPIAFGVTDRELHASDIRGRSCRVGTGRFPREFVEGGSDVGGEVRDRVLEVFGPLGEIGLGFDAKDVVSGLRVETGAQDRVVRRLVKTRPTLYSRAAKWPCAQSSLRAAVPTSG